MKFENVMIESFAVHLPPQTMTSVQIEEQLEPVYKKLKLPFGRLEMMTGIKERGFWGPGTRPSTIASHAAREAIKRSSIPKEDIGVLIHASVCRDFLEPATASVVHNSLQLSPACMIFDLSNACLGVINAFVIISNMIEQGLIKSGMVISGENSGPLLKETIAHILANRELSRKNIKKYIANLTIGSAAVAYILSHKSLAPLGHRILGGSNLTRSQASSLCQGNGNIDSLMMETDSEELLNNGAVLAMETWAKTKRVLDWSNETPDWALGHQVGIAHEEVVMKALGLSHKRTFITYPFLGNTGSAALPATLAILANQEKLQKGEKVALLGIGSGLSSVMLGVEW